MSSSFQRFFNSDFAVMIRIVHLKSEANRPLYIQSLRRMTPAQRLAKAIELSELGKRLFLHGLRRRFPEADENQIRALYLSRITRCHNRNY